tara:strand:+ start:255 stop:947 length:693 start_codon:yes stop_codon:yes gene_type:complete
MNYIVFKSKCTRNDFDKNNKLHFLSSIFSIRIAYILYRLGFSADTVTLIFGFLGLCSSWLYFYNFPLLGYIFWRMHIIFDMADGNIARATNKFNIYAKVVDKMIHILVNMILVTSLFLRIESFSKDINNLKLFIPFVSLYIIYFLFDVLSSSIDFQYYFRLSSSRFLVILKNICTQEGLILIMTILFIINKSFHHIPLYIYTYLLVFYNISYLIAIMFKLFSLKIKVNKN